MLAGISQFFSAISDWLCGGDTPYMTSVHCMGHDYPWIIASTILNITILVGYSLIAHHWSVNESKIPDGPSKHALARMKYIFILCAICGYFLPAIRVFWPAYRLNILFMVFLAYYTITYIMKSGGLTVIYEDLKNIKERESKLAEFEEVADSMPQIVWTSSPDGNITYFNKQWYEMTGWSRSKNKNDWDGIVHPDDIVKTQKIYTDAIEKGITYQAQLRLKGLDGNYEWYLARAFPIREAGKITKWIGTSTNIDAQKNAQESLLKSHDDLELKVEKRTQELKILNDRYFLALESAHIGSWNWDIPSNNLSFDKYLPTLFHIDYDKFPHDSDGFVKLIHPDDQEMVLKTIIDCIMKKTNYYAQYRVVWPNGEVRIIMARGSIYLKKEEPDILSGVCIDVTEQHKKEQELMAAYAELERSNKELELFASLAAHDLQDPLRTMNAYLKLLDKKYGTNSPEAQQYMKIVRDSIVQMRDLTGNLLAYARKNKEHLQIEDVDLNVLLNEIIFDFGFMIKQNNANVTWDELPVIAADRLQIRQVLQNLIQNAIKYHHPDRSPAIHIKGKVVDRSILLEIKDNGIGIEADQIKNLFQIYRRIRDDDRGVGFGLAMCKKNIERHGGTIWVESEKNVGSTFFINLPFLELA